MFLLVDKPKGITSHDVVDRLRILTGVKKIGHAGTLDPNATGLLIVGIGRDSTKKLGNLATKTDKTYIAEIVLGEERGTDDVEGKVIKKNKRLRKTRKDEVVKTLKLFIGKQSQVPPSHSAIKIKGKKAYELARKGKDVMLKPRKIMIYSIELISYKYPEVNFKVEVSSGTYIRSLARDIGRKLGTYAYLKNLRRTKIGKYDIDDGVKLDRLKKSNWFDFAFDIS